MAAERKGTSWVAIISYLLALAAPLAGVFGAAVLTARREYNHAGAVLLVAIASLLLRAALLAGGGS